MKENTLNVTGRILKLEERSTNDRKPFYMVDLETFYGSNIRFQAWDEAYEFIKRNQLRSADMEGKGGDYLDVIGYVSNYYLDTNHGRAEFTTFKTNNVKRPNARVSLSGKILELNTCCDIIPLPDEIVFSFQSDIDIIISEEVREASKPIHCSISKNNKGIEFLKEDNKVIIKGIIDNTNKRQTKIYVEEIKEIKE